ncbi:NAD-dependent epimerase/dehydratase family protein [Halonotius terrestris]|uniref:NAD-dependent epimerase/dehydratase family protein n=1 Tax=Halonotius terrestris TaxID=2487750 RepID=A0A8J8PBZ8_9EURY|nr:NAD(P)H-binding protein [Halonotius terrestris]TQQ81227.1 NAD-dependent epimerase/dehydratase family protein [Halonotius terrestris]
MRVLVTGATGFVGSNLVDALVDTDHEVTVLTRDRDRYDGPDAVRVVEGNVLEPGSFDDALDVDAAFYLIHSMGAGGDYAERDRRAARNFSEAASAAGVERVIYLGGLGTDRDDLSPHLRSRREVERILGLGDYDLTVLRAAIIIGSGSISFQLIRQLAGRLPVMITPKWVHTECQPIAIRDVIGYLVGVLERPETAGETYEIGGPEVLTYAEILKTTRRHLGSKLRIIPVPVLTPRLSSWWIRFVTDVDPAVARPLIDGVKNSVVVTDTRIQDLIPRDRLSFEAAVAEALQGEPTSPATTKGRIGRLLRGQ